MLDKFLPAFGTDMAVRHQVSEVFGLGLNASASGRFSCAGVQTSNYIEGPNGVWSHFAKQLKAGLEPADALASAYTAVEKAYYEHGKQLYSSSQQLHKDASKVDAVLQVSRRLLHAHHKQCTGDAR